MAAAGGRKNGRLLLADVAFSDRDKMCRGFGIWPGKNGAPITAYATVESEQNPGAFKYL